jgi:hypothetical protein
VTAFASRDDPTLADYGAAPSAMPEHRVGGPGRGEQAARPDRAISRGAKP